MQIVKIEINELNIAFKLSFKHAAAERSSTQAVVVKVYTGNGNMGMGEGCPREYVTSESLATALEFLNNIKEKMYALSSVDKVKAFVNGNRAAIDKNPAAWCAAELALLDAIGRDSGQTLEELLAVKPLQGPFKYTAILGDSKFETHRRQADSYGVLGFQDYKIKVSGNIEKDAVKIKYLRDSIHRKLRVRLDANNLWNDPEDVIKYIKELEYPVFALEEPLKPFDYSAMAKAARRCGLKIILDESLLNLSHFENLKNMPGVFIPNIRVSKMGGLIRSLEITQKCRELGMGVVVGAQVGETSLLTRAALTIAQNAGSVLTAQEGAFGTMLLEKDVTEKPLSFGPGGLLDITLLNKSGLGGTGLLYGPG